MTSIASKKSKKVQPIIEPVAAQIAKPMVQLTAQPSNIRFNVKNTNLGLWNTLKKNQYDECLQPLLELLDNAFASGSSKIYCTLDFEKNMGSIEDNGKGFGNDPEDLSRCFTYGPDIPKQTDLNEHGCGMKSSLAILDPNDSQWTVTWKWNGYIYQVKAPYARDGSFEATQISEWPGKLTETTGAIIEFPFVKENLSSLYEKKHLASFKHAIVKLQKELSHTWMFYDPFTTGKIQLYLNDVLVVPYVMPSASTEHIAKVTVHNATLANGAQVHIEEYIIAKDLPNSNWFTKAMASNGAYIFKNGRSIVKVNSGEDYRAIFGVCPDNHHNGMIVLINIIGPANTLPITVPTKNKFKKIGNPNYDLLIEYVSKTVHTPAHDKPSEEKLLDAFRTSRMNTFKTLKIKHEILVEKQISFGDQMFSSPSLDAIETIQDAVYIYEAKKENRVSLQNILQMYGNYLLATAALQVRDKTESVPTPVILIHADNTYKVPDSLINTIGILCGQSKIGFPLEIWNYKAEKLFPDN
jgi:hypothetical protein